MRLWDWTGMSSERKEFIRDLVSYTAIVLLSIFVLGAMWYLRAKLRKVLAVDAQGRAMSLLEAANRRYRQLQHHNSIIYQDQPRRATMQSEQIFYPNFEERGDFYNYKYDDPPPPYSSLKFPDVFLVKEQEKINNKATERPPSYRSVFVVKPAAHTIDLTQF